MELPEPIRQLYAWVAEHGEIEGRGDELVGRLYTQRAMEKATTATHRSFGTNIQFITRRPSYFQSWFGRSDPEIKNRLCIFARTGADGSHAALWLDPNGAVKVVHLGSGSGSTLVCTLGAEPVDFLRLLAIGYDELCWDEAYAKPPTKKASEGALVVKPHTQFQDWVRATFNVAIPRTGSQVVKYPSQMDDQAPKDPFARWVLSKVG